jgi:hypothetical protein
MPDLTLHINQSGAWRKAAIFDADRFAEVKAATVPLAKILASDTAWKILDADGRELWHFDQRRRGREAATP